MPDLKQKTSYLLFFCLLWVISACTAGINNSTIPVDETREPAVTETLENKKTARNDVSDHFTQQGIAYYNSGNYHNALSFLEKAISINPSNGTGYLYLAEIWIAKHNILLAEKYNRLALIYLRKEDKQRDAALRQQKRIHLLQNTGIRQ